MTETARLLKEKRRAAGLSQREVTKPLKLKTPQYWSNIERSLVLLSPKLFKPVARILNCDPKDLVRAHVADVETRVMRIAKLK